MPMSRADRARRSLMNASTARQDSEKTSPGRADWASAAGEGTEKKKGPQPLRLRPLPGGWMRGCLLAFHKLRRTSEQKVWALGRVRESFFDQLAHHASVYGRAPQGR